MSIASAQCNNRPLVNSFSPNTGFIGSTVTITGANFDATTITNNKVFFGATQATVVSATFGQLVVTVPVGASTSRIAVTNQCNLTAYSDAPFNGIFCPTPLTSSTYDNTSFELTGIYGAYNMLAVDMDLDGRADVVSSTNGNNLTIARNNSTPSNLSFVAHNFAGQGSQSIYTADFDGDGRQDLASRYSVFLNASTGPGVISIAAGVGNGSVSEYQIAAGDFNNDGKIDIVGESGANIYIGENLSTGVGNVSFGGRQLMHNVGGRATGIQTADVDGDGKIDILISQRNNHRAATLRNITPNGSSTFVFEAPEYWSVGGTQPYRCQIADFNKDGKIDFTTCNYDGTYNTAVLINGSTPGDIDMSNLLNLPSFQYNYRIQVGDVDGDGYPDIVSKSLGLNLFAVYRNTTATTGTTSFAPRIDYNSSATNEVSGIVIGDLDGDFVPDIATSGINSNTIRFHRNTSSQLDLTAPTAICQNITVALEPNGTVSITPEMVDNGSSDACGIDAITLSQTAFTCLDTGANPVTLYVLDNAGNLDSCSAIVTVRPAAIIVSGQTTVCDGQTVPLTANLGDSYQWMNNGVNIPGATSQNYTATITGDYTVVVTNAGGCSGESDPTTITVNSNPTVAVSPANIAYLCPTTVVLSASQSAIYQWKLNGVDIANATLQTYTANQVGSYTVEVIDLFGCSAISDPIVVTTTAAEINITGNTLSILDGDISPDAADGTDFGNTLPNTNVAKTFTIENSGTSTMDISSIGVSGTDASNWTISGISLPATVASNGSITFDAVFNGTAIQTYNATIDITSNDCDESDYNFAVTSEITCVGTAFSVCPGNINAYTSNSCDAVVNFITTATGTNPVTGTYTLSGATTGSGAGDASGLTYNIGTTTVTVTATNVCGSSTCSFDVIVSDTTSPNAISQNLTVYLDANGNASLTSGDINNGSNDACGIASLSVSPSTFDCDDLNFAVSNDYALRTDGIDDYLDMGDLDNQLDFSNQATYQIWMRPQVVSNTYQSYIESNDDVNYLSMESGAGAEAGKMGMWVKNGSTASRAITVNTVITANQWTNYTVVYDGTQTLNSDRIKIYVNGVQQASLTFGTVPTTLANLPSFFMGSQRGTSQFANNDYDEVRVWNKALSAVEIQANWNQTINGNEVGLIAYYAFEDGPGSPIVTELTSQGPATLNNMDPSTAWIAGASGLSGATGSAATLTVTDINGNTSTSNSEITVLDTIAPSAVCQNISVFLDASGNTSIVAGDIDANSTDNCSIESISIDNSNFTCANIGANNVILTVTDASGNSSTCTSIVTLIDSVSPIATGQDLTIYLDASGNATIAAADVDNGSSDACGVATTSIDISSFGCANVGPNNVVLTVIDNNGNSSTSSAIVTVLDTIAPTAVAQDYTVYLDSTGNGSIKVFNIENGSTDNCGISFFNLDNSDFSCADVGLNTVTLTVFDVNGNSSTAISNITVVDHIAPTALAQDFTVNLDANGNATILASDIDNGSNDSCGIASIAVSPSTFDCSDVDGDQSLQIITDNSWTLSTRIDSSTALSFPWPGAQYIPAVSTFTLPVVLGQPYGYPSIAVVPGSDLINANSHITYYRKTFNLTSVDNLGARIQLAVDDDCEIFINGHLLAGEYAFNSATFQGAPMGLFIDTLGNVTNGYNGGDAFGYFSTTSLDSVFVLGENEIIIALRNRVGGDRGGLSMVMDVFADFTGNAVTLTVTDVNGNTSTANASVTVVDDAVPTVITQDITVYLDASGNATVAAADVDNGSNDACGVAATSLDITAFGCANVGANTVTLTVVDVNGNSSSGMATVTVVDMVPPTVVTQNVTVYLDANGNASVAASDIDNGSADNCAVASIAVSPSTFDCSDVNGDNSLQVVTDSTWSLSTVVDSSTALTFPWVGTPLVPATSTFTLPVQLGQPYGYPSIVLVPGSDLIDANKHVTFYRKTFNLTTLSQLATRIRLSVDDDLEIFINGHLIAGEYAFNASSFQGVPHDMFIDQTGTVTNGYNGGDTYGFVSNTALDSIFLVGQNEIIVAVRNRVGGDRGGLSMVMDVFADFQGNAVSLSVTDVNGNTATGPATVIVMDTIAPVLVQVPSSFTAYTLVDDCTPPVYWAPPTATDACAVQSVTGTSHPGDHFPVGVTTVTYTALDIYGNTTTSSFIVTVVDTIAPTAICNSITVGLDATGFANITTADIDGGSTDICGIASTSIDVNTFDPSHVGAQTVTLTVVDIYGNISTCTSIVNVIDTIAPNVVCQDITLGLGSNGLAGITAADINNGSNDASGIGSMSIDVSSFSCATVGSNTVTLTVIDNNGNSASCMANVTVIDTTAPVVVAQNITINLSSLGQATITAADLDAGSSDACGIDTYDIDINSFGCNELGANTVTLTVTDVNGNSASQVVTVTVEEGFVVQMQTLPNIAVACNTGLGGKIINWVAPQVTTSTSCAPDACPAGNNIPGFIYLGTHDGHRYFCSDNSNYTWNQANAAAQAAGGHLAVINNQAENHYLACRVQAVYSWIGLNDVATEGQFEWVNGDAVTYTNWTGYEPNNTGGYYCGANCYGQGADQTVLKRWSGSWYDRRECNKHEFIMEVPCGNDVVVTQIAGPSAGSLFTTGTSTITYAAVDTVTGASDTTSFDITIGDCTPVYCPAKGVCASYEWIERIEMGSIDNTSGTDNGYADYTNLVTNHNKGQKVYFKLHPGFQGSKYKEYWRIFVDWNNDGDFYDYNECVYQGKSKKKKSGYFRVPNNAAAGNLRVRVVMKWGGYGGPCSIFSYGEVEDYTIVVDNATGASSKNDSNNGGDNNFNEDGPSVNQELFNLYPNPVLSGGEMTLDLRSGTEEEVEITISSATGQIVFTQNAQLREGLNSLSIKPGELSSGAYFIQISNTNEAIPFVVKE